MVSELNVDMLIIKLAEYSQKLASILTERELKIVTAESLTAGMLASHLADVAGASAYLLGAYVCYLDEIKQQLLNVDSEVLAKDGAVSANCVREMATNSLRQVQAADIAIAVSGFAGPENANWSEKEPCGTVYMAITRRDKDTGEINVRTYKELFVPERNKVRLAVCVWAMEELLAILAKCA